MRIGVTSMFSFRPHVEHLAYVSRLLSAAGHEIHGLTCDAALSHCYGRLLRRRSKLRECPQCIAGGIRTFPIERVTAISPELRSPIDASRLWRLVVSSVTVRFRTEGTEFFQTPEFQQAIQDLARPVETAYANTKRWIERNRLEAVLLFNGRMDALAGVVAACEDLGVPYISLERPWLAHGIYVIPNGNVLALDAVDRMCADFREGVLLKEQAQYAGLLGAQHFLGRNTLEWRVYNADAHETLWPLQAAGERVLVLPCSRNEFEGHPDWVCEWGDYTKALDHLFDHLDLPAANSVLRCHPNWAQKIGAYTGWRSEQHYTDWANRRGVHVIPGASRASTYDLIAAADIIVVNGSSTGIEGALRGKRVILVGHTNYQEAGFCDSIASPAQMEEFRLPVEHSPQATAIKALRFMYLAANRFPQYVNYVRARSNTRCDYFEGADAARIIEIFKTGRLRPDDEAVGSDPQHERDVAALLLAGKWGDLMQYEDKAPDGPRFPVERRFGWGWIDDFRDQLPRGDA